MTSRQDDTNTGTATLMFLQSPDDLGWDAFVDRYAPRILRWCKRHSLSDEDCEDVAQEVLVRLHKYMHSYKRDRGSFRGWLHTVTQHAVRSYVSSASKLKKVAVDAPDLAMETDFVDFLVEEDCLAITMEKTKLRVTLTKWRVFEGKLVHGRSYDDLETETGLARATLMNQVSEVKKIFEAERDRLKQE